MKKTDLILSAIQIPIDALAIILAFIVAYFWRSSGQTDLYLWPFQDYLKLSVSLVPVWLVIFATQGLYRPRFFKKGFDKFSAIFIGTLASWALFTVGLYFTRTPQALVFPRLILIYTLILSFIFILLSHWGIALLQRVLYKYGIGIRRVLLIGEENQTTKILSSVIQINKKLGYKIVHSITPNKLIDVEKIFQNHPFDQIILTDPRLNEDKVFELVHFCEDRNLGFLQTPKIFEVKSSNVKSTTLGGIPLIEFNPTPLDGWGRIIKRIIDLIGGIVAFMIALPFMLLIALLIKLDSRGPIFYLHERIGLDGNPFYLYKFRTMKIEYCRGEKFGGEKAEKYFSSLMANPKNKKEFENDFKLKNDPRITRIGKILRKTSLDEIPQFINILIGNLSLVGPRPIVRDEMDKYGTDQNKRNIIKPGLTGLWQVSGRNDISYEDRIKLDLYYIENWTLWLDISIMFKTLFSILKKNTY